MELELELENICFEIITNVGLAKTSYMDAIKIAKVEKDIEKVQNVFRKGDESFTEAHRAHSELLKLNARGELKNLPLLVVHSEDQLMSVETIKTFAEEIVDLYRRM